MVVRTKHRSPLPFHHRNRVKDKKKKAIPAGTDIVEIMVYSDEVICSRFIALNNGDKSAGLESTRFYYALLINEMDTVYQPFHSHPSNTAVLNIRLFFSGIVISCGSTTAAWSSSGGSSSSDLSSFGSWQSSQKTKYSFKYDIAMGISGDQKARTSQTSSRATELYQTDTNKVLVC